MVRKNETLKPSLSCKCIKIQKVLCVVVHTLDATYAYMPTYYVVSRFSLSESGAPRVIRARVGMHAHLQLHAMMLSLLLCVVQILALL